MLDELRLLFEVFNAINEISKTKIDKLDEVHLYNITYLSFFFGIGDKSTPIVKDLVNSTSLPFVENAHACIVVNNSNKPNSGSKNIEINISGKIFKWNGEYRLGEGHLRRLSHYIRHLFQIVKFVDDQPTSLLNQEEKYNYISNLRAQLSVHEQLLLYYNAISVLGKPWTDLIGDNDENYIERYCLLKSIPLNSADFYQKPEDRFQVVNKKGKAMFEWMEIKGRMLKLSEVALPREEIIL